MNYPINPPDSLCQARYIVKSQRLGVLKEIQCHMHALLP